jgi:hypothetical protein
MCVTALWASAVTAVTAMTARHVQFQCSFLLEVKWSRLPKSIAPAANNLLVLLLQLPERDHPLI